ncbi:MAG: adenylate kinase [Firmicutes bacterium]|nr:adenylate kinase [Bacillota bacterium]
MKLIILGAPGSGKGSQAPHLNREYGLVHLATGDILRKNIKEETPLGLEAKEFIDNGKLVPDEIVIKLVEQRISEKECEKGVFFDGFPRTLSQAEQLDKIVKIDKVIYLEVDFSILLKRITGRRSCVCGRTEHIKRLKDNKCECGKTYYQRDDDTEEMVKPRLETFLSQTAPLIDYYKKQGKLITINGDGEVGDIFEVIKEVLN